jgi:hypothetical protein
MNSKKDKQTQAWETWTDTLTAKAKAALQRVEPSRLPVETSPRSDDEEADAYASFRDSLTGKAQEWLDAGVDTEPKPDEEVDTSVARWGLVEAPDGEWATMRLFKTPEGLAKRIASLEGQDVVVAAFFGLPLQVTRGTQRYLILPGGQQAVMIPIYAGGPCKLVPANVLDSLEIQDDGFLGPPELANTLLVSDKLDKMAQSAVQDEEDEDENDV